MTRSSKKKRRGIPLRIGSPAQIVSDKTASQDTPTTRDEGLDALIRHAQSLYVENKFEEALEAARHAVEAGPNSYATWANLGIALRALGRSAEAVDCYKKSLSIAPDNWNTLTSLGNAYKDLKQFESAISCHRRALELEPWNGMIHQNLGVAFASSGRHQDAVEAYNRALRYDPHNSIYLADRSTALFHLGDYRAGWLDYEARLHNPSIRRSQVPETQWRGQPFPGKRLMILSEQGIGDGIRCSRYFSEASKLGGELVVECRPELLPLLQTQEPTYRLVEKGGPLPDADLYCYMESLPGLFNPDLASVSGTPYLAAPDVRRQKFADILEKAGNRLKVGIIWSGSVTFGKNRDRALTLNHMLKAFTLPGVQLFSLQKGKPEEELRVHPDAPIIDLAPLLDNFSDTAAAVSALDLVIMTDSSVAHLCGALGRPVWVLLSCQPFWIFAGTNQTTPWYDSMRLFRSDAWDNWVSALDKATAALLDLALRRPTASEKPTTNTVQPASHRGKVEPSLLVGGA